mmetsp:Transcript_22618/g.71061  ORF Transcript_22618/g.71061 Transcript_22618/m.71061 type:complete len:211 (-) Transcript_22618:121-753(-)|eukprot:scaffold13237_cov124-Isochrysis_galbana.AAC.3
MRADSALVPRPTNGISPPPRSPNRVVADSGDAADLETAAPCLPVVEAFLGCVTKYLRCRLSMRASGVRASPACAPPPPPLASLAPRPASPAVPGTPRPSVAQLLRSESSSGESTSRFARGDSSAPPVGAARSASAIWSRILATCASIRIAESAAVADRKAKDAPHEAQSSAPPTPWPWVHRREGRAGSFIDAFGRDAVTARQRVCTRMAR